MPRILSVFFLPPLNFLILFAMGFVLRSRKWRRTGNILIALAAGSYVLLSMPVVSAVVLSLLEDRKSAFTTDNPHVKDAADAVVVLGAGRVFGAPELGGKSTVPKGSLQRLRFAARLAKASGKPVLVTGGTPGGDNELSEGELMRQTLEEDFGTKVTWTESHSVNTIENARLSKDILFPLGIKRVYVVTHAFHMPRARYSFEKVGFQVVPVPVGFLSSEFDLTDIRMYLPSANAMASSFEALHEWVGLLWYKVRF